MKRDPEQPHTVTTSPILSLAPTHSPEGVDLTLIRWMLSLTPLERIEVLQAAIDSIGRLRGEASDG
jgi:hypothetical protein